MFVPETCHAYSSLSLKIRCLFDCGLSYICKTVFLLEHDDVLVDLSCCSGAARHVGREREGIDPGTAQQSESASRSRTREMFGVLYIYVKIMF